jgi:hypothetical protein
MSMRHIVAIVLALAVIGTSTVSVAESWSSLSTAEQVTYGTGSFFGSLLYSPAKAGFCGLGAIGSAVTAIMSRQTASKVLSASCRGTWVITPDVLQGHERIKFIGDEPPARTTARRPASR